ncbi:hypothetical protein [Lysobacter sp. D1-1-M9]|uniref:hypothetical protein n=1 Tax=Novilysobacter longmucuonensis TaxID=3098603 RepID=UPI002FC9705F
MLTSSTTRTAYLLLMLAAMSVLVGIATLLFRQGLVAGAGEALMLAWVLLFVVALPLGLLLLPLLTLLSGRRSRSAVIPFTGEKVP